MSDTTSTQIRIRPEARRKIDQIRHRFRLSIVDAVDVMVDQFERLPIEDQLAVITRRDPDDDAASAA